MTHRLSHLRARGEVHMVDVGHKVPTRRIAIAECEVHMSAAARRALKEGASHKGDCLATARIAGIQAAKRTWELIPLCHPVPLSHVIVELRTIRAGVHVIAHTETVAATGVEMEALTAASVAALALYDMLKAVDKGITISHLRLREKHGGKSGSWSRRAALKGG